MKNLVLLRSVNTDILRGSVIRYLIIESRQLRNLYEVPESFLGDNAVGDIELIVGCLLGEDCCPRVETPDLLPFKFFRSQILEQEKQLRQRVGDCSAAEKSRAQITSRPLLDGTDGIEKIQ